MNDLFGSHALGFHGKDAGKTISSVKMRVFQLKGFSIILHLLQKLTHVEAQLLFC
jgi:hypothetical protein